VLRLRRYERKYRLKIGVNFKCSINNIDFTVINVLYLIVAYYHAVLL